MSHDSRIKLTKDGVSLSRLVFGAWRLLDSAARPDADQLARLIGRPRPERLSAIVKALEINLDRQQWFAILEASEGRPVA